MMTKMKRRMTMTRKRKDDDVEEDE